MKVLKQFLLNKSNGNNRHTQKNYSEWFRNYDCNFYIEKYFQDMLYMERKRAKRSNSRFLLMQANIGSLLTENGDSKHVKRIVQVLSSFKRETDIAGWYKHNTIMGIIFTDTGKSDEDLIRGKIHKKLLSILNLNQLKEIKLSFQIIP